MGIGKNNTWNISGGQVNIANDNSTINVSQNNGVSAHDLELIVNAIKSNSEELSADDKETLLDGIEMIQEEIVKPEPKGKIVSNGIKLIAPILTIANGMPVLSENIQKFIDWVTPYMN